MNTNTAQASKKIPGKVELNSTYYGFRGQTFFLGNCIGNVQVSQMIRSKIRKGENYPEGTTLERLVDFDLANYKKYISKELAERTKQRALNGVSQTIFLIRNPQMREPRNGHRFIGAVVLDNKGEILDKSYFYNHSKTWTAVYDAAEALLAAQKGYYKHYSSLGKEDLILS